MLLRRFSALRVDRLLTLSPNVPLRLEKGATIDVDSGTVTAAAGAATLNAMGGVVTSEALTTAAGADYTLTLTNNKIAAGDLVFVSLSNGTNTTAPVYPVTITPAAGSVVIVVRNANGAAAALNGTIKITFIVFKK